MAPFSSLTGPSSYAPLALSRLTAPRLFSSATLTPRDAPLCSSTEFALSADVLMRGSGKSAKVRARAHGGVELHVAIVRQLSFRPRGSRWTRGPSDCPAARGKISSFALGHRLPSSTGGRNGSHRPVPRYKVLETPVDNASDRLRVASSDSLPPPRVLSTDIGAPAPSPFCTQINRLLSSVQRPREGVAIHIAARAVNVS
jgi:hypothetical protein